MESLIFLLFVFIVFVSLLAITTMIFAIVSKDFRTEFLNDWKGK